jgi:hypothetical protein
MIEREDLVDYETYKDTRDDSRRAALAAKRPRRVHLGEHLTLLFENEQTLLYQIQEIMLVEKIAREADILHEIEVYNRILGSPGQLCCVLLIEIEEAGRRKDLLTAWLGLERHVYVRLADGSQVYASYDPEQVGDDRLSAVQYLLFEVAAAPVAVGVDFPDLAAEVELTGEQHAALVADVAG